MTTSTNTSLGEIKLAGDLAGNNNGLAPALTTVLSTPGAFVAPTITVDAKGRVTAIANTGASSIAARIPDASTISKGVVQIGTNINVSTSTTSGTQTVNFGGTLTGGASTGLCSNGATYSFTLMRDNVGPLTVSLTANTLGTVNDLISEVNSRISPFVMSLIGGNLRISSNTYGPSSSVVIGDDKVFAYMTGFVSILSSTIGAGDGVISVNTATSSVKGVASFSSDFTVTNGNVAVTLRNATTSVKGVVQIGSGLAVSSGVVSVPDATTSVKGIVQIGSGLSVTAGVVSANLDDATTSTKGYVQIGAGLVVSSGVVSVPDATTSVKGIVQIGSGLSVAAGVVSTAAATNSTAGTVKSNNTNNINIAAGAIDVGSNVALKNQANTFTKAQVVSLATLTHSASITPDFSLSNVFYLNATSNFTLNAPTNVVAGGTYIIIIKQDATGSRVCTFNPAFKFGLNAATALSTLPNKVDIISITAQTTGILLSAMQIGF